MNKITREKWNKMGRKEKWCYVLKQNTEDTSGLKPVNKVYCNKCKWFTVAHNSKTGLNVYECGHRYNVSRNYRGLKIYQRDASDLNRNNDCGWFEPKWWSNLLNKLRIK